ncbi:mitochondrial ribonuclease P catalytic subunit isoform X2 [Leptidea sinapis]|nr:mitochondrial ribonuclease P catalytic subunit isoform X2 [Leptidea sinapis]
MLKFMVNHQKFDAAITFAEYIKAENKVLSIGAINALLHLYSAYGAKFPLPDNDKKFILDIYNHLYDKYEALDYTTSENLLHALCVIDEWKKATKVIEDIKLSGTPSHSAYSTLISTIFRCNKKVDALKLIDESVNNKRPLLDKAYDEWIKYVFRKYKDKKTIIKYLDEICTHIADSCSPVTEVTINKIKESYTLLEWNAKYTEILRKNGECMNCHQLLSRLKLSNEEFESLQHNVKEKLIVGSDLFLKSTPDELETFLKFVEKTAPYDVVLDALNIAYVAKTTFKDKLYLLSYAVDYFAERELKILVLGRKHMLKWGQQSWRSISKKSFTFFTDNLTQDDPYFITAAILSGSHTDFVSRDLLRGHRFVLKQDKLRNIFQRWQWQHQWKLFSTRRGLKIQSPLKFTPCAQKNNGVWHIPYEAANASAEGKVNDGVPDCATWLCMQPNSKLKS